jgi:hypothetical protein
MLLVDTELEGWLARLAASHILFYLIEGDLLNAFLSVIALSPVTDLAAKAGRRIINIARIYGDEIAEALLKILRGGGKYGDEALGVVDGKIDEVVEAARKVLASIDEVLSNKTFTNSTGKVDNYVSPVKGMDAALADFDKLNPTNVRTASNGTVLGDLQNGTTVNIHPRSSVNGAPTLQIPDPSTGISIKIRY